MAEGKLTIKEAAALVGVDTNTIRNWRDKGKLKSAEKLIIGGVPVWYVDSSEVIELADQSRRKRTANQQANNSPSNSYTEEPTATSAPGTAQMLDLIRESITRPLTDLIATQSAKIEELSKQVGSLEERLSRYEQSSPQPARQEPPQAAKQPDPMPPEPPAAPVKKRWWQR
jgi:hypothetical protein